MAPRLASQKPKASGGPRAAVPGDNLKAAREAEEAQFLKFYDQARKQTGVVAEAKAALKVEQDALTDIFRLAKAAGIERKTLTEVIADASSSRKNLADAEEKRARYREWAGLPVGVQMELADRMPDGARDEQDWNRDGYRAGMRGETAKPPTECPPRFTQTWLEGWHEAQERLAWSLKAAEPVSAPPPAAPEVEDEDEEEEVPEPITTGPKGLELAEKVFAKPDGEVDAGADTTTTSGDDFQEASPEELAGQIARKGIVEARDAEEEEEPTVN